jgi:amyloid beta precursor protein binding protein 1
MSESQSIESATTLLSAQPDNKTRRYDRQLRLWAASGQSALERSRILVLGADATSTSILKNLVLPGIGHFTLVDDKIVTGADAGNNFFLDGWDSVGKNRASEAVSLLRELNDGVEGDADTRSIKAAIGDKEWLKTFTIVIAHNLDKNLLDELAATLWEDIMSPHLIVIRSAGFLAEFYIQFHDHTSTFSSPPVC